MPRLAVRVSVLLSVLVHLTLLHTGALARARRDPRSKIHLLLRQILSQTEKNLPSLKFLMEDLFIVYQPSNTNPFLSRYEMSRLKNRCCTDAWGAHCSLSSQVSSVVQNTACLPFSFPQIIHIFFNRKTATVCDGCVCVCEFLSRELSLSNRNTRNCRVCETNCQLFISFLQTSSRQWKLWKTRVPFDPTKDLTNAKCCIHVNCSFTCNNSKKKEKHLYV